MGEITLVLEKMGQGEERAADELMALVYRELRTVAAAKLARESAGQTLQPTALVHEAWLRLGGDQQPTWRNRRHFFHAAAEAMRRILIDRARHRAAARHGGGQVRVAELDLDAGAISVADRRIVAVSEALDRFGAFDARKAELVKLRYFGGLTIEEAAEAMEISVATAKRWWAFARAWLYNEIET